METSKPETNNVDESDDSSLSEESKAPEIISMKKTPSFTLPSSDSVDEVGAKICFHPSWLSKQDAFY